MDRHFQSGDRVNSNWQGKGVYYPGTIVCIRNDGKECDIAYDDGDFECRVNLKWIRALNRKKRKKVKDSQENSTADATLKKKMKESDNNKNTR